MSHRQLRHPDRREDFDLDRSVDKLSAFKGGDPFQMVGCNRPAPVIGALRTRAAASQRFKPPDMGLNIGRARRRIMELMRSGIVMPSIVSGHCGDGPVHLPDDRRIRCNHDDHARSPVASLAVRHDRPEIMAIALADRHIMRAANPDRNQASTAYTSCPGFTEALVRDLANQLSDFCEIRSARYTMISATLLGCATARNKGTCDNRVNIRRDRLEERVLHALRHHLMDPELFKEFCDEFTREENRLRMDGRAAIDATRAEIKKINRDLDMLVNLILKGGAADKINAKMVAMEARKKELEQTLATADEPPPLLHPNMAHHYRAALDELYLALQEDCEANRLEAAEVIRSLVDEIILLPEDGELKIDVRGDLAGILSIAVKRKKPAGKAGLKRVATSGDP